jgi:hypothetical protein
MILCTLKPRAEPLPSWMLKAWLLHDTDCLNCHGPLDEHLVGGLRCVRLEGSFTPRVGDLHTAITASHHLYGEARQWR